MPKARLLHSPEIVEVLEISATKGTARIVRQGFVQEVPLIELVVEEDTASSPPPAQTPLVGEAEVYLDPALNEQKVWLIVQHGLTVPAFYGVYIRAGKDPLWAPLLGQLVHPGQLLRREIPLASYPLPWQVHIQRVLAPESPLPIPPPLGENTLPVRIAQLLRGRLTLPFTKPTASSPPPQREKAAKATSFEGSDPAPTPPPTQIDLHVEKLAPHLLGAPSDAIFSYQKQEMARYLLACYTYGYEQVVVIHGIGEKRLYQALVDFCREQGW
ncbi:MAG: hypothetical protein D6750_05215, partial [Bacteroidetes bacterium]